MTVWPETLWLGHFGQNDTLVRESFWPETLWSETLWPETVWLVTVWLVRLWPE